MCAGVECDRHSLSINTESDNLCGYICQVVDYAVEQSLAYSDTQESISMNYIMYESGIQNNTCLHIKGLGLVITSVTDGG